MYYTVRTLIPVFTFSSFQLSQSSVDENSARDTLVGMLNSLDQDTTQTYSYRLLNSAGGRFKVDRNAVKVAASNVQCLKQGGSSCPLNYEAQKQNKIRLRTTDSGNPPMSYEKDFVISVRNLNDQPRELKLSNNKVRENATSGTVIGRFTSRDEDVGQVMTYSLSHDDSRRFRVDAKGALYKANSLNYETQTKHTIHAVVQDNGTPPLKTEKTFTIEVLDVNEAPVNVNITSQAGQLSFPKGAPLVEENSIRGTAVGTIEALDQDSVQKLTFKLDDDAGGKFTLSLFTTCQRVTNITAIKTNCTTVLRVSGDLNYEETAAHSVVVRVTDEHALFTTQQFWIRIVDQNDQPTDVTIAGSYLATVDENSNGSLVGDLVTMDEDPAQTHTYKLIDDAAGRFLLSSGKLYVASSVSLDFERQRVYTVKIQCNDSGIPSLAVYEDFQIQINDLNEAPTNVTLVNADVTENSPAGTVIGQFNISDPDNLGPRGAWQTHVCDVTGEQVGAFVVENNVLCVGMATLDFEVASSIDVQIKCSDSGSPSLYLEQVLKITVLDVNEAPTQLILSSNKLAENLPSTLIGNFSTIDPDNINQTPNKQTLTYTIQGNTDEIPFVINGDALTSTRSLDYEAGASWNLTVQSRDSGKPKMSIVKTFQIVVTGINARSSHEGGYGDVPFLRMYYVIAGVGGALLLVIVVSVASCRRNTVNRKKTLDMRLAPLTDQKDLRMTVLKRHQIENELNVQDNLAYQGPESVRRQDVKEGKGTNEGPGSKHGTNKKGEDLAEARGAETIFSYDVEDTTCDMNAFCAPSLRPTENLNEPGQIKC